jgi:hypothetical protein
MKSNEVNGCGACSGWMKWIKPPHHRFFEKECCLHDELYNAGGTKEDRKKADVRLFEDMVKHSIDHFKPKMRIGAQVWFIVLAYVYYKAVRWFGSKRFNYKNLKEEIT